jgi:hypothetical protein
VTRDCDLTTERNSPNGGAFPDSRVVVLESHGRAGGLGVAGPWN